MKWYCISIDPLANGEDAAEKFILRVRGIRKSFREPDGFCLYESDSDPDRRTFYLSCPDKYIEFLEIPIKMMRLRQVEKPDTTNLRLVTGEQESQVS